MQSLKLLVMKIIRGNYPPPSSQYSSPLRNLIDRMIKKDPKQRPSVNEILAMPFIKDHIGGMLPQVGSVQSTHITLYKWVVYNLHR